MLNETEWPEVEPIEVVRMMHDLGGDTSEHEWPASYRYMKPSSSSATAHVGNLLHYEVGGTRVEGGGGGGGDDRDDGTKDDSGGTNGTRQLKWMTMQDEIDQLDKAEDAWLNAVSLYTPRGIRRKESMSLMIDHAGL